MNSGVFIYEDVYLPFFYAKIESLTAKGAGEVNSPNRPGLSKDKITIRNRLSHDVS